MRAALRGWGLPSCWARALRESRFSSSLYNYFQTKEQLVTDRDQHIQDRLGELIRSRPPAITPAAAIRDFVLESVAGIRGIPPEIWRGELGYLAAISPTVHRLALELIDRQAAALAAWGDWTAPSIRFEPRCCTL